MSVEAWDDEQVQELHRRLKEWGSPVLIRQFATSGTTRTTVHRDNTKTRETYPGLANVSFKSHAMGHTKRLYGEFAYLGEERSGE